MFCMFWTQTQKASYKRRMRTEYARMKNFVSFLAAKIGQRGTAIEKEQKEIHSKINKIKEKRPEGKFSKIWTLRDNKKSKYDIIKSSKQIKDGTLTGVIFGIMLQGSKQTVFRFLYRNNKVEKKFDCRSECSTIQNTSELFRECFEFYQQLSTSLQNQFQKHCQHR